MATLAAREGSGPRVGLPGLDHLDPAAELVAERLLVGQGPLLVRRESVRAEAPLWEVRELVGELDGGLERLALAGRAD